MRNPRRKGEDLQGGGVMVKPGANVNRVSGRDIMELELLKADICV